MWGTSSGNAYQNAPSANTLYNAGTQRYNQDTGQVQQATPQWRGPGFTLTSSGNVPSNLLTPGSEGGSRPISLPSSSGGPGTPGWVKPQWTGSQSALQQQASGSIPPLQEANGKDTEFGMLLKMGPQGRDPGKERRFQQLMSEWQASHPAPTAAPATQPTPPPVSTPMEQRGTPPTLTGATGLLGGLGNFIGRLFGGGVSPAQTAQSKSTQGLQAKSLSMPFGLPPFSSETKGPFEGPPTPEQIKQGEEMRQRALPIFGAIAAGGLAPEIASALGLGSEFFAPLAEQLKPLTSKIGSLGKDWKNLLPAFVPGLLSPQEQQPQTIWGQGQDTTQLQNLLKQKQQELQFNQPGGMFITPQGQPIPKGLDQTGKTLSAPTDKQVIQQTTQGFKSGSMPIQIAAANLASEPGIKAINKEIDIAQKTGDFDTVGRLTDLARAAQQNMVFQQQIQSIMDTIASSFGVNPSALTAMRQPMVQQGTFQALEAPPQQPFTFFGNPREGMGGQPVFFPNQLREVNPAQMNRPPQFPFANPTMGQNPLGNSPFTTGGQPTNQFLYGKSSVI